MSTTEKPRIPSSLGQRRIRIDYNSEEQDYITLTKKKAAKLIDLVDQAAVRPDFSEEKTREYLRLKALAMTAIEEASMWITKAETI